MLCYTRMLNICNHLVTPLEELVVSTGLGSNLTVLAPLGVVDPRHTPHSKEDYGTIVNSEFWAKDAESKFEGRWYFKLNSNGSMFSLDLKDYGAEWAVLETRNES